MAQTIKVLARGDTLVLDVDFAKATGQRRYIGRDTVTAWSESDLPPDCPRHIQSNEFLESGQKPIPHTAYPRVSEPQEVRLQAVIRDMLRGDLLPADEASAKACGVPFDATFGGFHPSLCKTTSAPVAARGKAD